MVEADGDDAVEEVVGDGAVSFGVLDWAAFGEVMGAGVDAFGPGRAGLERNGEHVGVDVPVGRAVFSAYIRSDSFGLEGLDDSLAEFDGFGIEAQLIADIACDIVEFLGNDFPERLEPFENTDFHGVRAAHRRRKAFELHDVHGGLEFGHAVVGAAEEFAFVTRRAKPVGPPEAAAFGELAGPFPKPFLIGDKQSAFSAAADLVA